MLASRPNPSATSTQATTPRRSPVTLQDLLDDLLWPHLLRSWKLALAPGRVFLCFLLVVGIGGIWKLTQRATGEDPVGELWHHTRDHLNSIFHHSPEGVTRAVAAYNLFIKTPADFVKDHPVVALVCMPVVLLMWCAVGGAVCRSCACEVSLRAALPWRKAVQFGLRKTLALFAALAGPLVLVWCACLLLRLLGLAFFTTKVMGLAGGALFIAPLLLCLVISLALFAYLLAHSLLIPAVACEGTDSFDAVQRCYAYTLARPGRLVGYTLISLLGMIPAAVIVGSIVALAVLIAANLTGAPAGPFDTALPNLLNPVEDGHLPATHWLVNLWTYLVLALMFAYFISLYFCAATSLYLVIRRLVDGQDIGELWMPPAAAEPAPGPDVTPPSLPITEKADYT
jgi:hypothetical protein